MASEKIHLRMCIACRSQSPKEEMLRVAKTQNGVIMLDESQKSGGRGAYVCKKDDCISRAVKTGAFKRALSVAVPEDIIEKLYEKVNADG